MHMPSGRLRLPRRWGMWLSAVLAFAILTTSGVGWGMVQHLDDSLNRVDPFGDLTHRPDDDSLDFLVVGTDEREGVPRKTLAKLHAGGSSCDCTDTILLVHLSPDRDRATVVSIPRDSYLPIPAHRDKKSGKHVSHQKGKINAAYGMGGPSLTVDAVEQATGIRIDHYLQVNFLSFVSTVDALGGVEVCTPTPLKDPKSGLDLRAGTSKLDGATALQYVRSRHLDASADVGRMKRQQKFLAQVLKQMRSSGTLFNPTKLNRVLSAALSSVKADKDLTMSKMISLASSLKGLSPANTSFVTVPTASVNHRVPGWGSTVRWDKPATKRLFSAIREDQPIDGAKPTRGSGPQHGGATPSPSGGSASRAPSVPPGQVRVRVLNATHHTGLGSRMDRKLHARGFHTTGVASNARNRDRHRTVIQYDPRWDTSVRTLHAALPHAKLQQKHGLGATMRVLVGSDNPNVHKVTIEKSEKSGAGSDAASPSPSAPSVHNGKTVTCP